jgi:hypothetical protein
MTFIQRAKFLIFVLLCAVPLRAQESVPAAPLTNASAADVAAIQKMTGLLVQAVAARDANTLRLFGVNEATGYEGFRAQTQITHIAAQENGALVRQKYEIIGTPQGGGNGVLLASGAHDLWLARQADGRFAFTNKQWDAPSDAASDLADAAREEWANVTGGNGTPQSLLHLVAERRGGRWVALRRSRWNGVLYEPEQLAAIATRNAQVAGEANDVATWLRAQMQALETPAASEKNEKTVKPVMGTAHFLLQANRRGWVGLGATFDPNRQMTAAEAKEAEDKRRSIESVGYFSPKIRRDFGLALAQVGLINEASDELDKAETMQPGLVGAALLAQVAARREHDPQTLAASQMKREAAVGLDSNHPVYIINALIKERAQPQTPLQALRIGLEYAKLADDEQSTRYMHIAERMANQGVRSADPNENGWAGVIYEHLKERERLRGMKPPSIVRSALFTVRCTPNDAEAIKVLAALEAAQHTVYGDFGIPMGNTEVIVWPAQSQFQRYTSMFTPEGAKEFVAALTLTKLISTQEGPLVLGEEVNVFTDPRANIFSTLAHEYGHVAVRQLSRGRQVPVWLNEGIATAVEGGYDGYLPRVRKYAQARRLLTWPELYEWNVDGERAFLAYSQANSMIDFIVEKWGRDAVLQILKLIGQDVPPENAIRQITQMSSADLWARWAREGIR